MITVLLLVILGIVAWRAPKAFAWLMLGPVIGIPLGIIAWTIAIQFDDHHVIYNLRALGAFVAGFSLLAGFMFARCK